MKGWMGQEEEQTNNTGDSSQANKDAHASAEAAHASAQAAAEAAHQTAHAAAAAAAAQATKAAEEALAAAGIPKSSNSDYLQQVGDFVAAALDPLGIDVQVDVETPGGERTTVKPSSNTETMEDTLEDKKEEVQNEKMDVQEREQKERSSSSSSSDDEEWTVLNDKKEETKTVEIPIQIVQDDLEAGAALYPSLPATETSSPAEATETPMEEDPKAEPPKPSVAEAVHPDPRIQVALQAMMNMGFSNDGGWLANLLEAKDGDIGKVLDILQPVKK